MKVKGWIGVDLDGTLAHYDERRDASHIGEPIPTMLERVKGWLAAGIQVRIVTARVNPGGTIAQCVASDQARQAIRDWTLKHLGVALLATCEKNYDMVELWDDRAVGVVKNTGEAADHWAVSAVLQCLLEDGVGSGKLEQAAAKAGYVLQYLHGSGEVTVGRLRARNVGVAARNGQDGVILLHGTPAASSA